MANLIDLDLLSRFKTNADSTYLIKHLASGTLAAQTIEGDVNIGTDTNKRNLTVSGDLYVKGTEYIVDVETLNSSSDLIVINANNDTLVSNTGLVTLTGGTATYPQASPQPTSSTYKKNVYYKYSGGAYVLATSSFESGVTYYVKSSPAYALTAYDPIQDVIQLGSGTYKSTGEFTFGTSQAQAIATRESSIEDRSILIWDGGTHQIRDSHTLISDLQPSSTILTSLAGVSTSSTGLLKITNGAVSIDTTSYVTSSTEQTISGNKTFTGVNGVKNTFTTYYNTTDGKCIQIRSNSANTDLKFYDIASSANAGALSLNGDGVTLSRVNNAGIDGKRRDVTLKLDSSTAVSSNETYTLIVPSKSGTLATLSDIPASPTNYVTTNTTQTGLTGNKTTSGNWKFTGTSGAAITVSSDASKALTVYNFGGSMGSPYLSITDTATGSVTRDVTLSNQNLTFKINGNDNTKYKSVSLKIADQTNAQLTGTNPYIVTLPYITGTVILDAGAQTISGNKTFIGTTTIGDGTNGSLVVNSGSTFYADSTWLDGDGAVWGTQIGGSQGAQRILSYDWREDQQTYQTEIEPGYIELSQLSANNNYSKSVKIKVADTASISSNDSYTLTVPLKTGTLATISDLPTNYITTNTNQTLTSGVAKEMQNGLWSWYNSTYGQDHRVEINAASNSEAPTLNCYYFSAGTLKQTSVNENGIIFEKVSTSYTHTVTLQMDQSIFSSNAAYTLTLPKRTDTVATLSDLALATNAQIDALFGISA